MTTLAVLESYLRFHYAAAESELFSPFFPARFHLKNMSKLLRLIVFNPSNLLF